MPTDAPTQESWGQLKRRMREVGVTFDEPLMDDPILARQFAFQFESGQIDKTNAEQFLDLSQNQRATVVRETARMELERIQETNRGLPLDTSALDWIDMMCLAEQLREPPRTPFEQLQADGVPIRFDDVAPAPLDTRHALVMAECGVPVRGRQPDPLQYDPTSALKEMHVPLRESASQLDRGIVALGDHPAVVKALALAMPPDHPDRGHLPPLIASGAALSGPQRDLIQALAAKHSAALARHQAKADATHQTSAATIR